MVTDYVWMYARGVPDELPTPSNGYWMPGMSFYLVPWLKLLGPTFRASQIASLFLALPFIALVWLVGRELTGNEAAALVGAGIAAVDPGLVVLSITPDAAVLQGLFVAGSLLCMYYGFARNPHWLALAGLLGGLGHLTRNDGIVIVPVLFLCALAYRRGGQSRVRLAHLLYFLVPYGLVVAPWMARNALVFGSASPPDLLCVLFLPRYQDLFRADLSSITVQQWLTAHGGWGGVIRYDILVLLRIVQWLLGKAGHTLLIAAIPFLCVRRPAGGRPFLYMLGFISLAYSFVVPHVGLNGGYQRAFTSVMPLLFAAAAGGIWVVAECIQNRLPRVRRPAIVALVATLLLGHTAARFGFELLRAEKQIAVNPYVGNEGAIRAFFSTQPPDRPVFADDPWHFGAITAKKCYQTPTDGMDKLLEVARRVDARYLLVMGISWNAYPGIQQALEENRIARVRELPTIARFGGLHIFDLESEKLLAEGRRLNEAGRVAGARADYPKAIKNFESAAKLVADYVRPRRVVAGNLTKANYDYARKLEAEGRLREALARYKNAERRAPEGMDTAPIATRLEALQGRIQESRGDAALVVP